MDQDYHFTHLKLKNFNILSDKEAQKYLMKWCSQSATEMKNVLPGGNENERSIQGQLKLATFCFNEPFQNYQKYNLVEAFFKDTAVTSVLNQLLPNWSYTKDNIEKVESKVIQCTVSSMSFFDRLFNEANRIVTGDGIIRHCLDDFIEGFTVADELRKMLLDEESDNYGLFSESDRNELIFRVFQFLVLGGQWCQYEDSIAPYLSLTKILYKDLLRVERNPETKEIEIKSLCLKVKLIGKKKVAVFPTDADHRQNFVYLIIDPTLRQLTLFAHEYGGQF